MVYAQFLFYNGISTRALSAGSPTKLLMVQHRWRGKGHKMKCRFHIHSSALVEESQITARVPSVQRVWELNKIMYNINIYKSQPQIFGNTCQETVWVVSRLFNRTSAFFAKPWNYSHHLHLRAHMYFLVILPPLPLTFCFSSPNIPISFIAHLRPINHIRPATRRSHDNTELKKWIAVIP